MQDLINGLLKDMPSTRDYIIEYLAARAGNQALLFACEHPGVFATDRETEFCPTCGKNIPYREL
jgi:hypothetical protein